MSCIQAYRYLYAAARKLHGSQRKALVAVVVCLVEVGNMRSFDIAHAIADRYGILFKSATQRFYRLINNRKVDDLPVWAEVTHHLIVAAGKVAVIAIDWTEWHEAHRVLTAAVCIGRRAMPIFAQTFSKTDIPRSQNSRENAFIKVLGTLSPLVKKAVLVFDRGFRRASLIKLLIEHTFTFIIRLEAGVKVSCPTYTGLLTAYPLRPGDAVDFGVCLLTIKGTVAVRVVGVWAVGQAEPWWLATSIESSPKRVAELYDRRMAVEEQFRDTKGSRFGLKMEWTRFRTCEGINRMYLLAALAMVAWTAAGIWACHDDPTMRLVSRSKGPRRSYISIGIEAKTYLYRVLRESWLYLTGILPETETRTFAWAGKK
jgi:hypothetical protein